ncbi:NADH-quinone oxidoreductase subunit B family protein [Nocardia sp. NBC_00403]|uniref:NADH-quinone oxidoreductase subunit B family protein n=1 Tax=Nocardia sp. NBC_00403 TaxID=2975990 RepID=UPI003FA61101
MRKILRVGRVAEPAPAAPAAADVPAAVRGSLRIRHVDADSCNGCEVEISGAFGPVYDAERYGARLVASPRHADALLVTGVVTRNMAEPLQRTLDATPRPRLVLVHHRTAASTRTSAACRGFPTWRGLFGGGIGGHRRRRPILCKVRTSEILRSPACLAVDGGVSRWTR